MAAPKHKMQPMHGLYGCLLLAVLLSACTYSVPLDISNYHSYPHAETPAVVTAKFEELLVPITPEQDSIRIGWSQQVLFCLDTITCLYEQEENKKKWGPTRGSTPAYFTLGTTRFKLQRGKRQTPAAVGRPAPARRPRPRLGERTEIAAAG